MNYLSICLSLSLGDEMLLDTPENYLMNDTWVTVNMQRGKVFRVAACSDVHIILSDLNGVACKK